MIPALCPACGYHTATPLVRLGKLAWFRCRACGYDYPEPTYSSDTEE